MADDKAGPGPEHQWSRLKARVGQTRDATGGDTARPPVCDPTLRGGAQAGAECPSAKPGHES